MIATKILNDPLDYCHIVTSTTHKTLRGPRGGIIMMRENIKNPYGLKWKNGNLKSMGALLDAAVFPGTQGGPLEHVIGAKAVAFGEAMKPEFKEYMKRVQANAKLMSEIFMEKGYNIVSGGTDNHCMLIDLRSKGITGKDAEELLGKAEITVNKNMVPFDTESPFVTSGIRIGTSAITTRGIIEADIPKIVNIIDKALMSGGDEKTLTEARTETSNLMSSKPLFQW
jgi:glycine hydroxymethyltransferase